MQAMADDVSASHITPTSGLKSSNQESWLETAALVDCDPGAEETHRNIAESDARLLLSNADSGAKLVAQDPN